MPYLTGPILANGAMIDLRVELSAPRTHALRIAGQAVPAAVSLRGMIDTGADCTFIDTSHLHSLNLQNPVLTLVADPSGLGWSISLQYEVSLTVLHPGRGRSNLTVRAIPIVDKRLGPHLGYEVLIGRDVLRQCLLCYDGQHQAFTLAY